MFCVTYRLTQIAAVLAGFSAIGGVMSRQHLLPLLNLYPQFDRSWPYPTGLGKLV